MQAYSVAEFLCVTAAICLVSLLLGVYQAIWVEPERIRSRLRRQGIKGPPPSSFLYGNLKEIQRIHNDTVAATKSSSSTTSSDDGGQSVSHHLWVDSMFPHYQQWARLYGEVYMYSTGKEQHIFISKPQYLKELNLHKSLSLGKPPYLHKATEPMLGNGIIQANGHHWAIQRKIIAPEFFLDKVKGMIGLMEESTKSMIEKWEGIIQECEGGFADMYIDQDLRTVSADIISKACFGSSYVQGKQIFDKLLILQAAMSKPDVLLGLPDFSFIPTKKNREMKRLKKDIECLILKIVQNRIEESEKGDKSEKDLLQSILKTANANGEEMKSQRKINQFIVDSCKNIYFAGNETTALVSSWCLMLLALYPEWQERIRAEIAEVCASGVELADMDTIRKLKSLNMVIQETLRLYSPPVIFSRSALSEIQLGELTIPKGTNIWSFIPLLHRDSDNWGLDANEFKPERFAQGTSEACKYPQNFMPFGMGSRLCVGQNLAMVELKVILSLILSRFSFSPSPGYRHSPIYRMLLAPEHGMKLVVKRV